MESENSWGELGLNDWRTCCRSPGFSLPTVAAQRGIPLRAFVTEAVAEKLAASLKRVEKPWVRLVGGLKNLHKETVRINRIIKSEFEKNEPEDWE
jgi:hypothetical protein